MCPNMYAMRSTLRTQDASIFISFSCLLAYLLFASPAIIIIWNIGGFKNEMEMIKYFRFFRIL